jgi:sulfur carrier protein ThiS
MQITVKLYGSLRRFSLPDMPGLWVGEVKDGMTVAGFLEFIGTTDREIAAAAINDHVVSQDTRLSDGDLLVLVTPVGGGKDR